MSQVGPAGLAAMNHHDLLDVAEAMLLDPLRDHPEEMRKFRDEVLYAPLEGSRKAKRKAQADALAQFGVDMSNVKVRRVPKKDGGGLGGGSASK
jgi:hypothetical protein